MNSILLAIYIFTKLLYYMIIISIILSWLKASGFNIRIKFIDSILEPIYSRIRNTFPTKLGIFDFSPIYLILILAIVQWLIFAYNPDVISSYKMFFNF